MIDPALQINLIQRPLSKSQPVVSKRLFLPPTTSARDTTLSKMAQPTPPAPRSLRGDDNGHYRILVLGSTSGETVNRLYDLFDYDDR